MKANPNYTFLVQNVPNNRIVLLQGGTRSGKTFSVLYYIIYLCLNYSGMRIDCVRDTHVAARGVLMDEFIMLLKQHGLFVADKYNKVSGEYELNGNLIAFVGCDMTTRIYGKSRDILFVNEAQLVSDEAVNQLFPRTRGRIICDYNPALHAEHWLFRYINDPAVPRIITTYRDNPHLTSFQIADIESRRDNAYWWKVYGSGEIMLPQGIVFERISRGNFPPHLQYVYGADFGFVKDPTALVKVAVDKDDRKIYVEEIIYDQGLLRGTDDIYASFMRAAGDALIVGDAHGQQQRLIYDLAGKGLNIVECRYDSVISGVMEMMNYDIVVCGDSRNLYLELTRYRWADKGKTVIADAYNHAIDAMRYAFSYLTGVDSGYCVGASILWKS